MRIVVTTCDVAPAWARYQATEADYGGPPEPVGTGATPLEAVADLLWHLDLEDTTPYCLEIRDR